MSRFAAPLSASIWDMKYRFKDADGKAIDATVEDTWRRIARSLASLEIGHPGDALRAYALARRWHVRIYQAMSAAFTPQDQSDSRWLPVLRDRVLFPLSRIPPLPRVLSHLVSGTMIPPMASLESHPKHSRD